MFPRILFLPVLLLLCSLTLPDSVLAQCGGLPGEPCPIRSTVPCGINLIGHNGGTVADPYGEFTITVADANGDPIVGADVWLDFGACCDDIRLAASQYGPGMVLGPGKTVHAITGSGGIARFRIMGAATASSSSTGGGCADVWAQNGGAPVLLTDGFSHPGVHVGAFDLDGALPGGAGVGAADLSLWEADFFASLDPSRADYDCLVLCFKRVGAADLAKWQQVFFGAASVGNGPSFISCP